MTEQIDQNLEQVTFGAGCFWCTEAVFTAVEGVHSAVSGYAGGHTENPTYYEVVGGNTGHAEACQVTFDPNVVSFKDLLEIFWVTHDPTTLNRQGADVGTQYRSIILYQNEAQREASEHFKKALDDAKAWPNPIVTEIAPLTTFYKAEISHQDYYARNQGASYCSYVIRPKLEKLEKAFGPKLKR